MRGVGLLDVRRARVLPKGIGDLNFSQATETPSVSPFGFTQVGLEVSKKKFKKKTKKKNINTYWISAGETLTSHGHSRKKRWSHNEGVLATEAAGVKEQKRSLWDLQTGRCFLQQLYKPGNIFPKAIKVPKK